MALLTFEKIKDYYDNKLWTKGMVWDAESKGKITETQYTEITGEAYPSERPIDAA